MNAWKMMSGLAAMSSVSQGRRPADRYVAHTATIHMNASSTTPRTKYLTTSMGPAGKTVCQACAVCAVTYWNIPDRTGYSM